MTIKSQALRDSAGHPDAHCMLNIAGVCQDETESKTAGNVLCHIRFANLAGGGQKPDDFCATFGCGPCHTVFDGNGVRPLPEPEWIFYAMRGMVRTQRWWVDHGYLQVKGMK